MMVMMLLMMAAMMMMMVVMMVRLRWTFSCARSFVCIIPISFRG